MRISTMDQTALENKVGRISVVTSLPLQWEEIEFKRSEKGI